MNQQHEPTMEQNAVPVEVGKQASSTSLTLNDNEVFLRSAVYTGNSSTNQHRHLLDSSDTEVPESFQAAWETLLMERDGNIGVLDGFQLVADILMEEEGFRKLTVGGEEKETESIRRSYYSHFPSGTPNDPHYSCVLLFSRNALDKNRTIMIQSALADEIRRSLPVGHVKAPFVSLQSSRFWISNAYGGSLRSSVVEMYRNIPELVIKLKDELILKLKAIIAHGLTPPLLVGLDALPLDILERIFLHSTVKTVVNLAKTCTRTRSVSRWENVWRTLARREFTRYKFTTDEEIRTKYGTWREAFMSEWSMKCQQLRIRNISFRQTFPPPPMPSLFPWNEIPPNRPRLDRDPFGDDFF